MDRPTDTGAVEKALADYYDQEAGDREQRPIDPDRVAARDRFMTRLGQRQTPVLEVGTGPGRDARTLVAGGLAVVGVDLSLEHARRANANGALVAVASVRNLPFCDGAFTALWSMSTLMHVPNANIVDALGEVRRVLAPGALAAFGVWGGSDVEEYRSSPTYQPPRLFSCRSDGRWRSLLSTIGTVEEFETWARHEAGSFWYQWAVVSAR